MHLKNLQYIPDYCQIISYYYKFLVSTSDIIMGIQQFIHPLDFTSNRKMFNIIKNNYSSNSLLKNITQFSSTNNMRNSSKINLVQTTPSPRRNQSVLNFSLKDTTTPKPVFKPKFTDLLETDAENFEKLIQYNKKIFFTPDDQRSVFKAELNLASNSVKQPVSVDFRQLIIHMLLPPIEPNFDKIAQIDYFMQFGAKLKLRRLTSKVISLKVRQSFSYQKQFITMTKADKVFKGSLKRENSIIRSPEHVEIQVERQDFVAKMVKQQFLQK